MAAISAVEFGRVRIANKNQQQWHDLGERARPHPGHKSARGRSRNARRSSQLCLREAKISKDERSTSSAQLAQ